MSQLHTSVLLNEVIDALGIRPGMTIVDCTSGYGGHLGAMAECLQGDGSILAIDRDGDALEHCQEHTNYEGINMHWERENYSQILSLCAKNGIKKIDCLLVDCGLSSPQLDNTERGFSFRFEAPLDMRMDQRQEFMVRDYLQNVNQADLETCIRELGEERFAGRIARCIKEAIDLRVIQNSKDLSDVIFNAVPSNYKHGRIHPSTRTFQALRIKVNAELESLQELLNDASTLMGDDSRMAAISFHSLEDRILKNTFLDFQRADLGKRITRKPIRPSEEEILANKRSRSAKLRVFEFHSKTK
ncbi:MAG: 16S rRNA (cytosine1402-N4)-methyltransferase [Candidatus Omnitrophota bacterium]|jgi:16S rRNA (cytosine1402-N4)-methyltransferase